MSHQSRPGWVVAGKVRIDIEPTIPGFATNQAPVILGGSAADSQPSMYYVIVKLTCRIQAQSQKESRFIGKNHRYSLLPPPAFALAFFTVHCKAGRLVLLLGLQTQFRNPMDLAIAVFFLWNEVTQHNVPRYRSDGNPLLQR